MKKSIALLALLLCGLASQSGFGGTYQSTGWVRFDIRMDNGRTYFYPFNGDGSYMDLTPCAYSRLELSDSGDAFGSVENARRIMGMALAAKSMGLRVVLGYNTEQAPACRIAELQVEWPQ